MNALRIFLGSICLMAAFNAQTAHAQLVVYSGRAAFDSAFPGASVEGWDNYSNGQTIANGSTLNGITYNMNSSNTAQITYDHWLTTSGSGALGASNLGYFNTTDAITFSFANPLTAFAIDINTFDQTAGDYTATLNNGAVIGSAYDPFSEAAWPWPGYYTGESIDFSDSTPFTSVTISDVGPDGYTLDTLQYVDPPRTSAVPEPSTIALLMVGLMGIAVFAIRRKLTGLK
jgi:hypothetical protein